MHTHMYAPAMQYVEYTYIYLEPREIACVHKTKYSNMSYKQTCQSFRGRAPANIVNKSISRNLKGHFIKTDLIAGEPEYFV